MSHAQDIERTIEDHFGPSPEAEIARLKRELLSRNRQLAATRDALADAQQTIAVLQGQLARSPRYALAEGARR